MIVIELRTEVDKQLLMEAEEQLTEVEHWQRKFTNNFYSNWKQLLIEVDTARKEVNKPLNKVNKQLRVEVHKQPRTEEDKQLLSEADQHI